jgi:hypothetical protein
MELKNEMICWKYSILGAVLVVILEMVLRMFEYGTFIGILLGLFQG